jgi:outer membrane protein OmpA-like peptidoglycan-associated protein
MLVAAVLMGLAGCAAKQGGGTYPPKSSAMCLPCILPCTPEQSCGGATAAAPRVAVTKERLELKETIYFDTGEATIKPVSYGLLDEVAAALKGHDELKRTEIEGHTDDQGDAAMNMDLSQRRAEAVREYLIKKGIDASRLGAKGYGAEKPIAPNTTDEGREANRRVEFKVSM